MSGRPINAPVREEQKADDVEFFVQEEADNVAKNAAVNRERDLAF